MNEVADELRSAMQAAADARDEAERLANYYWTGDGINKLDRITGCLSDTPEMNRAAGDVGTALRNLANAYDAYRAAARKALDATGV